MSITLDQAAAVLAAAPPLVLPGQLAIPDGPRIGSLCTGYGGLDMAIQQVLGGSVAWVSDLDPGATQILAHHHPDTPNLGDLTTTDWAAVEPVDIVCGGYPCQPFSSAGLRKGIQDERHIWPYIADALRVLRPRYAVFENVAGHLGRGFDTVLADLAALGFDAEWCLVRASEVGAPHRRSRLFILAAAQDADGSARDQRRVAAPGQAEERRPWADSGGRGGTSPADAQRRPGGLPDRHAGERRRTADAEQIGVGNRSAADADGDALREQPVGQSRRRGTAVAELPGADAAADAGRLGLREHRELSAGRDALRRGVREDAPRCGSAAPADPDSSGQRADLSDVQPRQPDTAWGAFLPAIRRWENATGRPAPRATDLRNRLNPEFVEWLMGLPAGHVTAVPGLTRNQALHALGNGVVPRQATAALRLLAARRSVAA